MLKKINIEYMENDYIRNRFPENSHLKDLKNEIEILKLLSNYKNSVKYYGDFDDNQEKIIVMERCDDYLEEYLKKRGKSFTVDEIKKIFLDVNEIFKVIQSKKIIHKDLKLKNFFIKSINKEKKDFIVKLGDYSIGKLANEINSSFSGLKVTPETAPEIILEKITK